MLAPPFHVCILWSGLIVSGIALLRAAVLWRTRRSLVREASYEPGARWRHVMVLVPILLFLLGLPSGGPAVHARTVSIYVGVDTPRVAAGCGSFASMSSSHFRFLAGAVWLYPPVVVLDLDALEAVASDSDARKRFNVHQGSWVRVAGQYVPDPEDSGRFTLTVGLRGAHGQIRLPRVPMIPREPLHGMTSGQWIEVTGQLAFQKEPNVTAVLVVPCQHAVVARPAASSPSSPWAP